MTNDAKGNDTTIDAAQVAELVRRVIARLQQPTTDTDPRLVTLETIEQHESGQLIIAKSAVVTPAARDEARRRGIAIQRRNESITTTTETANLDIVDSDAPERAKAILQQLQRRGVELGTTKIILSEAPASETYKQITGGHRAAMITSITDVERFATELDPTVWVLDMKRFNIPAAVNTVVKISQLGAR